MTQQRLEQIATRDISLGDLLAARVRVDGEFGRVDAIFIDLQAAIDCGLVDANWYGQHIGKTTKSRRWYSVVLPHGAVLVGHDDLEIA